MSGSKSYGANKSRRSQKASTGLWQLYYDDDLNGTGPSRPRAHSTGRQTVDPTREEFNADEFAADGSMGKFRRVPVGDASAAQSLLVDGENESLDDEFLGKYKAANGRTQRTHTPDLDLSLGPRGGREEVLRESVLNGKVTYVSNQNNNRPFSDDNWEPMDMDGSGRTQDPDEPRVMIRTESDLELSGPAVSGSCGSSWRECRAMCGRKAFWRRYVFVLLAMGLGVAAYAGLIVAIVKGMR